MRRVFSTMYYWGTTEATNMIISEIDQDKTISENIIMAIKIFYFFLLFVFYFLIVNFMKKDMIKFYSVLKILPLELVKKNKGLVQKLDKTFKGGELI